MDGLLFEKIQHQIKDRNYAVVPFKLSRAQLKTAALKFLDFLTLPQDVKGQFYYLVNEAKRGSDVGYVRKQRSEGNTDNKEYFHYNEYAEEIFGKLTVEPKTRDFFKAAEIIYREAKKSMQKIILSADKLYPGIYKKYFPEGEYPHFFLRFLKYDVTGKGALLAKGHYDLGGCTLALAESNPGLRIGRDPVSLQEIKHQEREAIFMPGLTFHKLTSVEFTPAWHDVIQKNQVQLASNVARWAIVFFADDIGTESPSYEQTHNPANAM